MQCPVGVFKNLLKCHLVFLQTGKSTRSTEQEKLPDAQIKPFWQVFHIKVDINISYFNIKYINLESHNS